MTLDEAIQRENKIAEENQKIVDTEIVFDDVSLSQLYCDDTEVIEEHLSNYRKCAEYHKQIADWLEELKVLRHGANELRNAGYEHGCSVGYRNAIDDFVEACDNQFIAMYGQRYIDMRNIKEIAEQLKEGVTND